MKKDEHECGCKTCKTRWRTIKRQQNEIMTLKDREIWYKKKIEEVEGLRRAVVDLIKEDLDERDDQKNRNIHDHCLRYGDDEWG